MSLTVATVGEFAEQDGKRVAPSEFRIFHAGVNASEKGDFLFDDAAAGAVMQAYRLRGRPLMMDYEHMSAATPPMIAPASATEFVPEIRKDAEGRPELWATAIKWTARAQSMLEAGEYRLFSPLFLTDDSKPPRILELRNVALTNVPALVGLEPLVAASADTQPSKESKMDEELKKLKEENAALTEKCTALEAERDGIKAEHETMKATVEKKLAGKSFADWANEEEAEHEETDEGEETKALAALKATVVAVTGKKDLTEACGALSAMGTMAKELVALKAKQEADHKVALGTEFTSLLEGGIAAGKILPFEKASLVSLSAELGPEKSVKWLKGRLDAQKDTVVQLSAPREPKKEIGLDPIYTEVASRVGANLTDIQAFMDKQRGGV